LYPVVKPVSFTVSFYIGWLHLPHPLPLSNQSHLDGLRSYYGWRGELKKRGGESPLSTILSPFHAF
jgi:hypothetical protein